MGELPSLILVGMSNLFQMPWLFLLPPSPPSLLVTPKPLPLLTPPLSSAIYCIYQQEESTGRQEPHRGHSSRFLCPEPCQCSIALLQYTTQPCSIHTRQWVLLHSVCDAVSRGAAGGVTLLSSDVYTPGALGILGS